MSHQNVVDTNGWDTVAAIKYNDVNKAIAEQKTSPTTFKATAEDNSASIDATFGTWALTTGGAGPNIWIEIPITAGTVTIGTASHTLTPCTAKVEVHAHYLPQPDNNNKKNLVLATGTDVASVEACTPKQSNFLVDASLKELLQEWLNSNLQTFNHVFAVADFNAEFDKDGLKWLTPSHVGYAVAEPETGATPDNSVFAVLSLIDGRIAPTGLVEQVSPYAIPDGADASFLLSSEMFLDHMVLPTTPLMFDGIKDQPPLTYFKIDSDNTRIRNTKDLTLVETKLDNGKTVKPTVKTSDFTIEVDTTELIITITDMSFTYSPGIDVHLNYSGRSTLEYDSQHQILDLKVAVQSGSGSVEVSEGMKIAEIVLGVVSIVAAIAGGLGGVVSKSASAAVESATQAAVTTAENVAEDEAAVTQATVSCLRGLVSGTPQEISQLGARFAILAKAGAIGAFATATPAAIMGIVSAAADLNYDSMPKITDLTSNAVGKAVVWPASIPSFKLASTQLNGACQFGLVHTP